MSRQRNTFSGQSSGKTPALARHFAAEDTAYARNVAALEKVQPEPLKADEISVRIGASWVDADYYKEFLMEILGIYGYYSDG